MIKYNIYIMDEWICEKDYTFKLYPKIGTW